jgi:hypothetical protein
MKQNKKKKKENKKKEKISSKKIDKNFFEKKLKNAEKIKNEKTNHNKILKEQRIINDNNKVDIWKKHIELMINSLSKRIANDIDMM